MGFGIQLLAQVCPCIFLVCLLGLINATVVNVVLYLMWVLIERKTCIDDSKDADKFSPLLRSCSAGSLANVKMLVGGADVGGNLFVCNGGGVVFVIALSG